MNGESAAIASSLEIKLLGELDVRVGGTRITFGDRRHRVVLGLLLLEPGRAIQTDRLADLVWVGEEQPRTARNAIQVSISRLRTALGEAAPIVRSGDGYAIEVPRSAIDLFQFRDLVLDVGGTATATVDLLRRACDLWRGPVLDGTFSDRLRDLVCGGIAEEYVVAVERRLELEIGLGRNAAAIVELASLVRAHPQREHLIGLYMLALYRDGQQARALDVYNSFRDALADSLGIDPGQSLQDLALSMLRGSAALSPSAIEIPAQLPPSPADFTGRAEQVAILDRALRDRGVCLITGPGGSGKSTLATHVSHRVAAEFPDGQLYVELHGMTDSPAPPENVLGRFLRALGDNSVVAPQSLDEYVSRFRTLTAHRRILFVLDDAGSAAQIRSLLPGSSTCAVLITSRKRLVEVAGATVLELGVMQPSEALSLFESIVGVDRVAADPMSASTVISSCGFLPLAVRIAGARLVTRKHWSLADLAARLSESRRLDELLVGDQAVRATISLTYTSLGAAAQSALRGLGFLGLPHFPLWVVAAVLDVPADDAEAALDQLIDVHLVEFGSVDGVGEPRFRLHDLVRLFGADESAATDLKSVRTGQLSRVASGWLWLIDQINTSVPPAAIEQKPEFRRIALGAALADRASSDPRSWFDSEYTGLALGIELAAANDLVDLSVELTAAISGANSWWRTPMRRTSEPLDVALAAARRSGNLPGEARLLAELGQLRCEQDRYAEARELLTTALARFEALGDQHGIASSLASLGSTCRDQGHLRDAAGYLSAALAVSEKLDDISAIAYVQRFIGAVDLELGRYDSASTALTTALDQYRETGSRQGEALVIRTQSLLARAQGALLPALSLANSAREIAAEASDKLLTAYSQRAIGKTLLRLGRHDDARDQLAESLSWSRANNDRWGAGVTLRSLGELWLASGDLPAAERDLNASMEIWDAIGQPVFRGRTLRDLALLAEARGDRGEADRIRAQAIELFRHFGAREAAELSRAEPS